MSLPKLFQARKMAAKLPSITKQLVGFKRDGKQIRALLLTDSKLPGGVKERVLNEYLPTRDEEEFVYVTAPNGFAQIALARVAKRLGKKATIFTSAHSPETREVQRQGGKVIIHRGSMYDLYQIAEEYMKTRKSIFEIPFGMDNEELAEIFLRVLKSALQGIREPKRLWLVSGSGFTLSILQQIWPNTRFMVIQVGKDVPEHLIRKQDTLFKSEYRFLEYCRVRPPYSSPPSYDAKLWEFFLKYGENGDYIWNTAAEIDDGKSVCRDFPRK